jgi:murein DD-endopeptidase MepM/ murein hydrolase activator NlpD
MHAGCDLYDGKGIERIDKNEKIGMRVYSVKKGRVINIAPFTGGASYYPSYVIEVHHGKFIARYGEVAGNAILVEVNDMIKANMWLARAKNVLDPVKNKWSGIQPMLHFEMYSAIEKGKFSYSKNVKGDKEKSIKNASGVPYYRRRDLIDPTPYLNKWKDNLAWCASDAPMPDINPYNSAERIV